MAITSGFYNAQNHDRLYNAEDFGFAMSLSVKDGVDSEYLGKLAVTATSGLEVSVASGRAWFDDKWIKNDAAVVLSIEPASTNLPRIDAVVLDINGADEYRTASLTVLTGTPASSPVAPERIDSDANKHWQHALAFVTVRAGAVNILATDIEDNRGSSETPYIAKMGDFDTALSNTSVNAVQNKVVTKAIDDLQNNETVYTENGSSASRPYTEGQYIRRNGQFYKVIADIASGSAFTIGTNIEKKSMGSELTEINNNLSDIIKRVEVTTTSHTYGAGGGYSENISVTIPNGYKNALMASCIATGSTLIYCSSCYFTDGTSNILRVQLANASSSTLNDVVSTFNVLCVRDI